MRNNKILLFDPFSGGHHEMYVCLYAKKLLELGNKVLVFHPNLDIFLSLQRQYGDRIKVYKTSIMMDVPAYKNRYLAVSSRILATVSLWLTTRLIIKRGLKEMNEGRPDIVFFLWLDSFLNEFLRSWMINLFFNFKWSGIYFHPKDFRVDRRLSNIQKPNEILKSRFCKFVTILDEGIDVKLSAAINKMVYVFPDITDETIEQNIDLSKNILNKAAGRKVVGLLGGISKRKGLLLFIDAIKRSDPNKYFFIIAGELSEGGCDEKEKKIINSFFKNNYSNCLVAIKRIESEKDFNTLVNSCDVLSVVYEDFLHSSNILTKAALFKKFVISSKKYLIAERVNKFQLGICINSEDSFEFLEAVRLLSQENGGINLTPNFEEYFSEHSQKKLSQLLSQIDIY